MENKRAIIIAGICFLVSLLLNVFYANIKKSEMTADFGDEVTVVVATTDIPEYGLITENMVTVAKVFKNFKQPQTVSDSSEIVGKATYVPISSGEQITLTKLVHQDGRPVLDRQVEKKMRAVTLNIMPHTGVGKLIRPGNHIDILAAPSYDSNGATIIEVKTMVQNALVLATGKNIQNEVPTRVNREVLSKLEEEVAKTKRKDFFNTNTIDSLQTSRPDDNYGYITVQLTPDDAEKILYLTATYGDRALYMTLRNTSDQGAEKVPTTLLDDVLGPDSDYGRLKRKPPPINAPKPRFNDIRGGQSVPIY
jgi:Flp pilus assembly protein CpaB